MILFFRCCVSNASGKNGLTGESGNVLNAFLAAYDPVGNLSAVSLKHRKAQIEFLEIELPFDWNSASVGKRIAHSNEVIRDATLALGIKGSARTVSAFLYSEAVMNLWHSEDTVKRADQQVIVTVPQNVEAEKYEASNEGEMRESLQIQAALAEIGTRMGFQIWLPRSDRGRVLTKWKPDIGICTYLSYDNVSDLRNQRHLEHLSDKVIEDYEDKSQEA